MKASKLLQMIWHCWIHSVSLGFYKACDAAQWWDAQLVGANMLLIVLPGPVPYRPYAGSVCQPAWVTRSADVICYCIGQHRDVLHDACMVNANMSCNVFMC